MELMSLLAKLTLDAKQFNDSLEAAQDAADSFSMPDDQELELDTGEYEEGLDEAEEESGKFSDSVGSIFKELKGVIVTAGIAGVVAGIVSTLKEGVNLAKEHGDMVDKQSQKMGISAKAYQEWSYALNLSGASIDDLNRGLRTWQQAVGDEDQTAKLGEAFGKLGIDAEKAFSQIEKGENLDDLLSRAMEALADYKGGDRGAIAETLFGRGANGLNALFNLTAEEIRDIRKEAEDLGLIMSDEEVKNAAAYTDAVTRLEGAVQGIKEAFVADLMPILTDAANTVAKIVAFFNPRTKNKSLSDQFAGDDQAFAEELATIEGTAAAAETLAEKLLSMGDTSKMTAEQYAIWKGTAEELISLVPSLGEVIDIESGKIDGNSDSIKENIKQWEALAKQKALQNLKEKKYQQIYEENEKLIDKQIEANKKAADAESAKVEAYHKFSDEMKSRGYGELDFTKDVDQQISALMDSLAEMGDEGETDALALGVALRAIGEASTEAGKAQAEANKIAQEIETAKQKLAEWEQSANELFGSASESAGEATSDVEKLDSALGKLPTYKQIQIETLFNEQLFGNAKGNWSVPYDNFPALLHRGERVLTKSQARQSDSIGGSGAIVNAIQGLRNDMANLKLVVGRKTFGKAVVDYGGSGVNSYIGGSESRLAAGYGT